MIPILYSATETSFTTNGLGRLADAVECTVTEERNGSYELFMRYPVDGAHFADISLDRLIYAIHDDTKTNQAFRVYKISKPINGVVSIYAEHISYQLNKMIVAPFTAASCAGTLAGIENNVIGGVQGFTFWTDKSVVSNFKLETPQSVRSILAGQSGSILDVYGTGEYEFDMKTVKLHTSRGTDAGVTLRYGKNITDITAATDMTNTYTAIVPYWTNGESIVMLPEKILYADTQYTNTMAKAVDFSSDFESEPTAAQLRARGKKYLTDNQGWIIKQNVKVDFVQLWQTEEYADYAPLQRVKLCDTLTVIYEPLDVSTTAEVVKVVYNVLLERYDEIEVGEASSNLSTAIADVTNEVTKNLPTKSFLQQSIERATSLITGGQGGYVQFIYNADGEPEEIVILDNPDIEQAVNVWRWNKNGLGFSSSGYNGTYTLAMTIDGHIVADFIDTGYLSAERIRTGILTALKGKTQFDVDAGLLILKTIKILGASSVVGGYTPIQIDAGGVKFNNTSGLLQTWIDEHGMTLYDDDQFEISFLPRDGGAGSNTSFIVIAPDLISAEGNYLLNVNAGHTFRIRNFDTGAGFIFESSSDSLKVIDTNNYSHTAQSNTYWVTNSSGDPASLTFVNGILVSSTGF